MSTCTDTIAALATPPGESGLAVIRVSGRDALDILGHTLRTPGGNVFAADWEHRRMYHGRFVAADDAPVDEVMAAVMRGPESYTGEDVVEISCHGGSAVVAGVLGTLFRLGVRAAEPGEFTRRAFLNGKIDLIQAEAVADLIHARTELQRSVAERQLRGELSRRIDTLADAMLGLLGLIEANIDFIEEGIDAVDVPAALAVLSRQRAELDDLLASAAFARPLRDGYRVVIAGPVNAGKSSIFNRLVGEARAIVTDIPGTTRDVLRETLSIDGIPFVLHDTAGLRDTPPDLVETIGIDRARDAAHQADVVMFVIDGREPVSAALAAAVDRLDASRALVVINKIDCPCVARLRDRDGLAVVRVSAENGEGLEALRAAMRQAVRSDALTRMARDRAILNARLAELLESARRPLDELATALEAREPLEILAIQIREIMSYYEEATGRRYRDGLLDVIFSRFCIGK
ncbi:MAG TPA: tRNA uridine-5-carboxymethylaminomethyl(34) synthesis GTPase MnmE [Candidatus Krumholzibacteria bacterium]|nr:tRNA uridine-5-carboxymethylaminomethyl(34) synthesis GTPase MnmE [Candidatus Krumholzibacteria bacterium]